MVYKVRLFVTCSNGKTKHLNVSFVDEYTHGIINGLSYDSIMERINTVLPKRHYVESVEIDSDLPDDADCVLHIAEQYHDPDPEEY